MKNKIETIVGLIFLVAALFLLAAIEKYVPDGSYQKSLYGGCAYVGISDGKCE